MSRRNKFGAKRTIVDGITFHSKAESERYKVLRSKQANRQVQELTLQPSFVLWTVGSLKQPVKLCTYKADFMYREKGKWIVEDYKGTKTAMYNMKRKMFLLQYPEHTFRETRWTDRNYQLIETVDYIDGKKIKV
jgi:hypothetical protein